MKDANLATLEVVKYVVKRFGLHMNKRLGQNFLIRGCPDCRNGRPEAW